MLELRPSSRLSIYPCCVGLVVGGNIVEMHCLGEAFPEARVLSTHGRGFVEDGGRRLKLR